MSTTEIHKKETIAQQLRESAEEFGLPPTDTIIAEIDAGSSVDTQCNCEGCETIVKGVLPSFDGLVACDPCVEKFKIDTRMKEAEKYWSQWCPKQFKGTQLDHADFARVWPIVKQVKEPRQNLIFCGESGTCKTRAALHRMKMLLAYNYLEPHALWADVLDEHLETKGFNSNWKDQYKQAPVLLIDDLFTAGASLERYSKYIKGLLDYRLRENKITIITTNLKARDIATDSEKFNNATKADQQRTQAIIRRLRGEFRMLDFDSVGDGRF